MTQFSTFFLDIGTYYLHLRYLHITFFENHCNNLNYFVEISKTFFFVNTLNFKLSAIFY